MTRHFITRSKRYTKDSQGKPHYGWSVRATREGYDKDHSELVCGLDVSDRTLRQIEALLYVA